MFPLCKALNLVMQSKRYTVDNAAYLPVGVVLAGGASTRMGRDKATMVFGGVALAAGATRRLTAVTPEVFVADRGRDSSPGWPSIPDGPGRGPAAGILGAALARPGRALLVLACDLPDVPAALLRALAALPGDLVLARHAGGVEPLCGVYRPGALAALAALVADGEHSLQHLVTRQGLDVRFLEGDALAAFGEPARIFRNLNTPEDLEFAGA